MGTYGIYSYIYPTDADFAEGLPEEDWITANSTWLASVFESHGIPDNETYQRWLYQAVNSQDWRCGSCGGCI